MHHDRNALLLHKFIEFAATVKLVSVLVIQPFVKLVALFVI